MPAVLALVAEVLANIPQLIDLGVNVANLISTTKEVIDQNGSPDDPQWAALDAKVTELRARLAVDPPGA